MPLPFLLEVLNDAKTPAAIKVKVSLATLPYTHPRQSTQPPKPLSSPIALDSRLSLRWHESFEMK
jgi:hypothetical protein